MALPVVTHYLPPREQENNSLSEQIPQILLWPTLCRCLLQSQSGQKHRSHWSQNEYLPPEFFRLWTRVNDVASIYEWKILVKANTCFCGLALWLDNSSELECVWVRRYFRSRITSATYPDICLASTHASVVTGPFDTSQSRTSIKEDTHLKKVAEDTFLKLYCVWLRIQTSNLGFRCFSWQWTSLLEWWLKLLDMATITISSL